MQLHKEDAFVKHWCPSDIKVHIGYLINKGQDLKVIDLGCRLNVVGYRNLVS